MPIGFNHDTAIVNTPEELFTQVGTIFSSARVIAPTGFLLCNGDAIDRTIYSRLFNVISPNMGIATITIASPGVITEPAHGFQTGESIFLTTTGTLPTGLSPNTIYFVINVTTDTFRLALNYDNAIAGTAINTSGTQSGVHSVFACPYGLGNGSTTFNLPDLRSSTLRGRGTSARFKQNDTTRIGFLQDDAIQGHRHLVDSHNHGGGNHNHNIPVKTGGYDSNMWHWYNAPGGSDGGPNNGWGSGYSNTIIGYDSPNTGDATTMNDGSPRTASETRMKNLGVNFFIKF